MLQALLWDVDGTVAETERDGHRVAFNLAFSELGLAWGWDERRYGDLLRVTGGRERLLADMATRADAPAGEAEREALARQLHALKNRWYAWLVKEGRVAARPGVLALLREAAAAGLRQGIATTTSRANVDALMARLLGAGWQSLFACVLCGEDTARKKPDPEVYLLALQQLGVSADRVLAVEDSSAGVAAARGAGLALLLRPSLYFPAEHAAAPDLLLCEDEQGVDMTALRQWWHRRAMVHA
jgi:HAD superfamily hydrolase (TIGR01509 family)